MSKCCGNCEWSISSKMEEDILHEQGYDYDDPTRPHAGDCCIGQEHDENFCCAHHLYIEGMEEYEHYVLYDDKYYGTGYLIVSKLGEEIVKFVKISLHGEGCMPNILVRAYEKNSLDHPDSEFREIRFDIGRESNLYNVLYNFSEALKNRRIKSVDPMYQGKNHLYIEKNFPNISLVVAKDVYGVKYSTDFVDVFVGDIDSCEVYSHFMKFYSDLSTISVGKTTENDIRKMLKK